MESGNARSAKAGSSVMEDALTRRTRFGSTSAAGATKDGRSQKIRTIQATLAAIKIQKRQQQQLQDQQRRRQKTRRQQRLLQPPRHRRIQLLARKKWLIRFLILGLEAGAATRKGRTNSCARGNAIMITKKSDIKLLVMHSRGGESQKTTNFRRTNAQKNMSQQL